MPVRCPKCGYSNDPEFRFCGMCGAPLGRQQEEPVRQKAPLTPPTPEKQIPRPSSLPSFSVMADDDEDELWPTDDTPAPRKTRVPPSRSDDSLFTRRESPSKPLREDTRFPARDTNARSEDISYSLRESYKKPKEEYSAVSGPSFLGLDPIASSEPAPQYLLEDDEPSGHGRLFVGILLLLAVGGGLFWQWQREGYPWNPSPKQSASNASAPGDRPAPAPATPGSSSAATPTSTPATSTSPPDATPSPENKASPPAEVAKEDKPEEKTAEAVPAPSSTAPAKAADDKPEAKAPKPTATPAKIPRREVRASAPVPDLGDLPDPSESLFIEGQKYLYGSGVLEDCNRARSKLMAAANQSNVKAQSTVATMYATGHCLPRNLPMAYHWFAVALHKDRDNTRLQRDLEMLWNQMTPEEKQMAIKTR